MGDFARKEIALKNAGQEILFQFVCTAIFVLSSILMITEFVSAQSIVKQFGKNMGIHDELQLQEGDSDDWDQWNGQEWNHTQIKAGSQDVLSEILASDNNIVIYVDNNQIPQDVINKAKETHDSSSLLLYLSAKEYTKSYEYSAEKKIMAVHFN